jgi:hypothetical protein
MLSPRPWRTGRPGSASLYCLDEELRWSPNRKLPALLNLLRFFAKPLVVRQEPLASEPYGVGDMNCIGAADAE